MFDFRNLDQRTRQLMLEEIAMDVSSGLLSLSPRLSEVGKRDYPGLLQEAARMHDDVWLADALGENGRLVDKEYAWYRNRHILKNVPRNTAEMIAEGEFNCFY